MHMLYAIKKTGSKQIKHGGIKTVLCHCVYLFSKYSKWTSEYFVNTAVQ